MILVDTHVLLDIFEDDPEWAAWSQEQLDAVSATDRLAINPVIYSELSIAFARIEELEAVLTEATLTVEAIPREALSPRGQSIPDLSTCPRHQAQRIAGFLYRRPCRRHAVSAAHSRRHPIPQLFPRNFPHLSRVVGPVQTSTSIPSDVVHFVIRSPSASTHNIYPSRTSYLPWPHADESQHLGFADRRKHRGATSAKGGRLNQRWLIS
jgi:predicted nucleic acid-binding protein